MESVGPLGVGMATNWAARLKARLQLSVKFELNQAQATPVHYRVELEPSNILLKSSLYIIFFLFFIIIIYLKTYTPKNKSRLTIQTWATEAHARSQFASWVSSSSLYFTWVKLELQSLKFIKLKLELR